MTHWFFALCMALLTPSVLSIHCFECDSSNHFSCTEFWDPTLQVNEQYYTNCSHIHNSKYCVKMTGIFDGKLGTKRFCSSKDWGTYCEYIDRPGDIQDYRSCISTCTTHGCNGSTKSLGSNPITLFILASLSLLFHRIQKIENK